MYVKIFSVAFFAFLCGCTTRGGEVIDDGSVVIEWSATSADKCLSDDLRTGGEISGAVRVYPTDGKQKYTITCYGLGGKTEIVKTVETPEPQISVKTRKPREEKQRKGSLLACMGLGGGTCYRDDGELTGFSRVWNAEEGETIRVRNEEKGLLITYTPISSRYSDTARLRRHHKSVVRWYRNEMRDLPGGSRMSHRRYKRLKITCRDFRHTVHERGKDKVRVVNRAVCLMPDGRREHVEYPVKPRVKYTARQDPYYRW